MRREIKAQYGFALNLSYCFKISITLSSNLYMHIYMYIYSNLHAVFFSSSFFLSRSWSVVFSCFWIARTSFRTPFFPPYGELTKQESILSSHLKHCHYGCFIFFIFAVITGTRGLSCFARTSWVILQSRVVQYRESWSKLNERGMARLWIGVSCAAY